MKAKGNYNPDSYGSSLRPEGIYQFTICDMYEKTYGTTEKVVVDVDSVDPAWRRKNAQQVYCYADGFLYAIFDAMGKDPKTVDKNYDYRPEHFKGKTIACIVKHELTKEGKGPYANAYLYPAFNKKWTPEPIQSEPEANPGDDVPF